MKTSIAQALMQLPAAPTDIWPEGAPFLAMMAGGTMTVEVFAPGISNADEDLQTMHAQDELYFMQSGRGELVIKEQRFRAAQGDAFLCRRALNTGSKISVTTLSHGSCFTGPREANATRGTQAQRAENIKPSRIHEILKATEKFGLITFRRDMTSFA